MNWRKSLYFSAQRAIGSRVAQYYREFLDLEKSSASALDALQQERLQTLLKEAASASPFYSARMEQKRTFDLSAFPMLTKNDVKTHFLELMTPALRSEYESKRRAQRYSWTEVKTGGSTGVPTMVIHDREMRDRGRAGRLFSQYLCGFPFGKPYFRLWGSMRDINQASDSWPLRVQSFLSNEILLNAFRMDTARLAQYLAEINRSNVAHMMAYTDAATELARFAQQRGLTVRPLESIMACAGTLTDDARATLQAVFGARIHNKYGSRECGEIACECASGGLHIGSNNVVVEVVGNNGRPLPPGQPGRLLITLLGNRQFFMIRYDIGDIGALTLDRCACGRPFPLLQRLEGRAVEFLRDSNGAYVSPLFIIHLVGVLHNSGAIRRFQLVQQSRTNFERRLETSLRAQDTAYQQAVARIERDLKAVLGQKSQIRTTISAHLAPTSSGKFLCTINEFETSHEISEEVQA
jgi:phenylacetate-CoA ligase